MSNIQKDSFLSQILARASGAPSAKSGTWAGLPPSVTTVPFRAAKLRSPAGKRAFYPVYKASLGGHDVAIKVLLDPTCPHGSAEELAAESANVMESLHSQVAEMASLEHENVVPVIAVCSFPPAVITPWAKGGSLGELLGAAQTDASVLPWSYRVAISLDAARGLEYLHSTKNSLGYAIPHGSLNPEALLLTDDRRDGSGNIGSSPSKCKIDLPIQWLAPVASHSVGTSHSDVRWMAPEQLMGEAVSPATDSYAFGTILWQLFTLKHPWGKYRKSWAIAKLLRDGATLPLLSTGDLPADGQGFSRLDQLNNLLIRCWSPQPEARPTFQEIVRVLESMAASLSRAPNPSEDVVSSLPRQFSRNNSDKRYGNSLFNDLVASLRSKGVQSGSQFEWVENEDVGGTNKGFLAPVPSPLGAAPPAAALPVAMAVRLAAVDVEAAVKTETPSADSSPQEQVPVDEQLFSLADRQALQTYGEKHGIKLANEVLEVAHKPGLRSHITMYHVFFTLGFTVNAIFMVLTTAQILPQWNPIPSFMDKGACGLTNISFALLMRTELFLQFLYWFVTAIARRVPSLSYKYWSARFLYNAPGGLHAACGTSAMMWITLYVCTEWISNYDGPGFTSRPAGIGTSITGIFLMALLMGIVIFAIPQLRGPWHNAFEFSHRYLGWALIPVLWAHILLKASYYRHYNVYDVERPVPRSYSSTMLERPNFYNAIIITILTLHPWLFVRRRKVETSCPQKNVIVIDGFKGHATAGHWGRISVFFPGQWHPFAVVSGLQVKGTPSTHKMIIARAGDWTSERLAEGMSQNPRKYFYVRLIRAPGFMYTTRAFKRIICVASGAGIAPIIPCVLQRTADSIYVIWVTSDPDSFGPVKPTLEQFPGRHWIHDTRTQGRPDVVALTIKAALREDAEAVYIVANPTLTYAVVRGCHAVGIKAFGAIWDS